MDYTIKQLCVLSGANYETVKKRRYRGWTDDQIINNSKPRGYCFVINDKRITLKELSIKHNISVNVLRANLKLYYRLEDIIRASKGHKIVKSHRSNKGIRSSKIRMD